MSPLQRRFKAVLLRLGEGFTVGAATRIGVFAVLPADQHATYLTDAEIAAAAKPIYAAYVPHDDPTVAGDTVGWNGLTLVVKRAVVLRHGGEAVVRLLVLA